MNRYWRGGWNNSTLVQEFKEGERAETVIIANAPYPDISLYASYSKHNAMIDPTP